MKNAWGFILIFISAASFGAMAIFGIYAYQDGLDTASLLFLRFLFASVVMLISMVIFRIKFPKGKTLLILAAMGAIGYAGQSFSYFSALSLIPASLVATLLYIFPALVTLLSAIFLKEKITRIKIFALILTLAGTFLVVGLKEGGNTLGILYALMAAIIYAIYIVVGAKATSQYGAFASSTIIISSACILYGSVVAIKGLTLPETQSGWIFIGLISMVSTVMAIVAFFAGVKRIGPVNSSMLSTFEPVVTVLLATWILGEITSPLQFLGMGLILGGALLLARGKISRK